MKPESPHILVLEDDPKYRNVLVFNLTNAGFKVTAAAESTEALALAEDNHFDLVLVDYRLSDYPGTDFIMALREREDHGHVPAILLTAWVRKLDKEYLHNRQSIQLMSKACSMAHLLDTISRILSPAGAAL